MSLNEILAPLPKNYLNGNFNSINVDSGGISISGNIVGNPTVTLTPANNANIDMILSGTGQVRLFGSSLYPAGPAALELDAQNVIIEGQIQIPFTPSLQMGGTSVGVPQVTSGRYSKLGKLVHFNMQITVTGAVVAVGNATISGLPFASTATPPVSSVSLSNFSQLIFTGIPGGSINNSTTSIVLINTASNASQVAMNNTNFQSGTILNISGFYYIA